MARIARTLAWIAILLGFGACSHGTEPTANPLSSELAAKTCEVGIDSDGVPRIRAARDLGALACLGLVHGRYRAWQMDFLRKIALGRKAEVVGLDGIRSDFILRALELEARARKIFHEMPEAERRPYWAYAHGVNRGFELAFGDGVPYEFRSLGYAPDPWKPEDTILLILLQSFDQTRKSFEQDVIEERAKARLGQAAEALLAPEGLPWDTTVLKEGEYPVAGENRASSTPGATAPGPILHGAFGELGLSEAETGSNNWVIAPSRSATGRAWLANDPHLNLNHPPFWFWAGVASGEGWEALGATLPGVPAVVSGLNKRVAWGLTNAYLDVADVVDVPESALRSSTRKWPVIWFRWWKLKLPFFFKPYRLTQEGFPVLPLDAPKGRAWILRWSGFDLGPKDFESLLGLMKATSVADMDAKLSRIGVPAWNFVFADVGGHIGFRAVGKTPRRSEEPPFGIGASDGKLENWSYLSPGEMPHLLDPGRGFVATANNRHWLNDSLHPTGRAYARSFRAFRIEELLAARKRHDLGSIGRIQCDVQAVDARFLLRRLLADLGEGRRTPAESEAISALRSWDHEAGLDCRACGIYRRWLDRIFQATGLEESGLYRALRVPDPELREAIRASLKLALSDLGDHVPAWGSIHQADFQHLSGLERFSAPPIPTPGDRDSVNPGTADWVASPSGHGGRYRQTAGASQRLIVEMTDPPSVYAALAGPNEDWDRSIHPPVDRAGDPWWSWSRCQIHKRDFPARWETLKVEKIPL